jgi:transcription elongation factor Elf1
MMARKKTAPATIEDWRNAMLSYPCPHCGHTHTALGRKLNDADHFTCGQCERYVPLSDELKVKVISDHVQKLRSIVEGLKQK